MGYMGLMDAGIANVIATLIADQVGKGPDIIRFRWYIASQQLHCFKTLPYIYSQPDLMNSLEVVVHQPLLTKVQPTWKFVGKWYQKVLDRWASVSHVRNRQQRCEAMLALEKYGPFKRIQRRWLEHMGYSTKNVPPSLMISDLDFYKAV